MSLSLREEKAICYLENSVVSFLFIPSDTVPALHFFTPPPLLQQTFQALLSLWIFMKFLLRMDTNKTKKNACPRTQTICFIFLLQIDNKGNHLLVHEESSINVPAIAAAHVIKRYIAQAADELSFEVSNRKNWRRKKNT